MNLVQKAALSKASASIRIALGASGEFPGRPFIQITKARAVARMDGIDDAGQVLAAMYPAAAIEKAADPTTLADTTLQPVQDFVELLMAASLAGQLGFTRIKPNLPISVETSAPSAAFVGEGAKAADSAWAATTLTLPPRKIVSIVTATRESVRDGSLESDQLVQSRMIRAVNAHHAAIMFSTAAASGAAQPAGLLNTAPQIVSSGTAPEDLIADLKALLDQIPADLLAEAVLVMSPHLAFAAGSCRNELGAAIFPGLGPRGGELAGLPVVTSSAIPFGRLIACVPREIYIIGDDRLDIAVSEAAKVDGTSVFATDLLAFRVLMSANWAYRRPGVVAYVDNIALDPTASETAS